jgi:hypothetical protein
VESWYPSDEKGEGLPRPCVCTLKSCSLLSACCHAHARFSIQVLVEGLKSISFTAEKESDSSILGHWHVERSMCCVIQCLKID